MINKTCIKCGNPFTCYPSKAGQQCCNKSCAGRVRIKHGHNRRGHATKTYMVWGSMIARCSNPKDRRFSSYGGRGIKVCKRWLRFENFLRDMGEKPEGMSIERLNNDSGYSPNNCIWADAVTQANNRRARKSVYSTPLERLMEAA